MYGCSLVFNGLNDRVIYRIGEKLIVSSHSIQNLLDSVVWSVLSIEYMELVVLV